MKRIITLSAALLLFINLLTAQTTGKPTYSAAPAFNVADILKHTACRTKDCLDKYLLSAGYTYVSSQLCSDTCELYIYERVQGDKKNTLRWTFSKKSSYFHINIKMYEPKVYREWRDAFVAAGFELYDTVVGEDEDEYYYYHSTKYKGYEMLTYGAVFEYFIIDISGKAK